MIDASEYGFRRSSVLSKMVDNSIMILFAGSPRKVSGDATFFEVNKNFYYLTGIDQEESILLLTKIDGEVNEFLFINEKNEKVEKWFGIKLSTDEAKEISGVSNVLTTTSFEGKINAIMKDEANQYGLVSKIYLDLEKELKIAECKSTLHYKLELEDAFGAEVLDAHKLVMDLRMVKSAAEIEMIREAIKTTDLGLRNVLSSLAGGRFEYNLRNVFENTIKEDSNSSLAFPSIVAGGKNAVILHYPDAKDTLKSNDLVLLDVGARHNYYCGDISRTYPISGKFSDFQKKIYSIVLECNKVTAQFMKPGVSLKDCQAFAKNYLAEECVAKGLIATKEDIDKVYYHSVSHHLGLDTHDGEDRTSVLVPGNVITCEPGLYFKEFGIGVRIEDDVLITEEGREVLSSDILKEVKDIERILVSK